MASGLKCRIHYNNDNISLVQAPNGQESKLYNDAVTYSGDSNQALSLWAISYSDRFDDVMNDTRLDGNGEHYLADVLHFIDIENGRTSNISNRQMYELSNNMIGTPYDTLSDFYDALVKTFYNTNGEFIINRSLISRSGIYSIEEQNNIVNSREIQDQIRLTIESIRNSSYQLSESSVNDYISTSEDFDGMIVMDRSATIGAGKFRRINPNIIESELRNKLGGIISRSDFDNAIGSISFDSIIDRYQSDDDFADSIYLKYSSMTRIPIANEFNGFVSYNTSPTAVRILQALDVSNSSNISNIKSSIDSYILEPSSSKLKTIEHLFANIGIDVAGLSSISEQKNVGEVDAFLISLNVFLNRMSNAVIPDGLIDDMSSVIDTYFGNPTNSGDIVLSIPGQYANNSLYSIQSLQNDVDLFINEGLIKFRDGIYQRVNIVGLDNAISSLYDIAMSQPYILPIEAYSSYGVDRNGNLDVDKLRKTDRIRVEGAIRDFIERVTPSFIDNTSSSMNIAAQEMVINKYAYGHPTKSYQPQVNISNEYSIYSNLKNISPYIYTDFLKDFYHEVLRNKIDNTQLYRDVLSHFDINERGIVLKDTDDITKISIQLNMPNSKLYRDLQKYMMVSKDNSFNGMFQFDGYVDEVSLNTPFYRYLYVNNSNLLPLYNGKYDVDGDIVMAYNTNDSFIKINNNIYERIGENGNITVFRLVANQNNSWMRIIDITAPRQIYTSRFNSLKTDAGRSISVDNMYGKDEGARITNKIEC